MRRTLLTRLEMEKSLDETLKQVDIDDPAPTDSLRNRLLRGDPKKFRKYITSTSTHGIRNTFTGKSKIRRLFWGVLVLCMAAAFLQGAIVSIVHFANVPASTTVHTQHVSKLRFPAVTVCNLNGFQLEYLVQKNIKELIISAIDKNPTTEDEIGSQCKAKFEASRDPAEDIISLADMIANGGQPLEELVVECFFLGKPCNLSDVFIVYPTPIGNCYTFNGRNVDKQYLSVTGAGFRHDLELTLSIHQNEYIGSTYGEAGALVSIHEQDVPALIAEKGITVPVGQSAYLAVSQHEIVDQTNTPSSDCIPESEVPKLELFATYDYSFQSCRGECILNDLIKKCKCVESVVSNSSKPQLKPCNASDLCCIFRVLDVTSSCNCSVVCNHTFYDVVPSYATFPGAIDYPRIMQRFNTTNQAIKDNLLKVHVFFRELTIERELTQQSYSLTALIADIGGQMGLFLGASIISLTEFLTFVFDQLKDRLFGVREGKLKKMMASYWNERKKSHPDKLSPDDSFTANRYNIYGAEDIESDL